MEHRVIRNSAMNHDKAQESYCLSSALYRTSTSRKHECHLLNGSCALTRSLPDTRTAQGGPHLPLLPLAPAKATPYCREPLALEDRMVTTTPPGCHGESYSHCELTLPFSPGAESAAGNLKI